MLSTEKMTSVVTERLDEIHEHLADLLARLHEANERFAESSKPLATLDRLNLSQREEVAKRIREANQGWMEVTSLISTALAPVDSICENGRAAAERA